MGDRRRSGTLNRLAFAWALGGAARYAILTAVAALGLAIFLPDPGAERFATTAYLAAIFAAVALIFKRFSPETGYLPERRAVQSFPAALGFALALVILLTAGAGFVTDPQAEIALFVYCFAAVGIAAISRGGALVWIHGKLARGGALAAGMRYAAAAAAAALVLSALLPPGVAELFAMIAFGAALTAALLLTWSLAVSLPLGDAVRGSWRNGSDTFAHLSSDLVFARVINAAALVLIASIAMASLLHRPYAEPFATVAYLAAIFATVGIGMECRRHQTEPEAPQPAGESITWSIYQMPAAAVERFAQAFSLDAVIRYAAFVMVAAFVFASPLWRRYAEPFVVIGYVAAVFLAICVGIQCRRDSRSRSVEVSSAGSL